MKTTQLPRNFKSLWTAAEDRKLFDVVQECGIKWELVAKCMQGRTGKQCRERWLHHVSPEVRKSAWSPEEDAQILQAVKNVGRKWAFIASKLSGRTDNAVKNRYHMLIRHGMVPEDSIVHPIPLKRGSDKSQSNTEDCDQNDLDNDSTADLDDGTADLDNTTDLDDMQQTTARVLARKKNPCMDNSANTCAPQPPRSPNPGSRQRPLCATTTTDKACFVQYQMQQQPPALPLPIPQHRSSTTVVEPLPPCSQLITEICCNLGSVEDDLAWLKAYATSTSRST